MKWITREKIKVDRVACPWLIQKFVDRHADLYFCRTTLIGQRSSDGIVFDVPNCELGHHGEDVSFNSILKKYRLTDPALVLLGEIVRAPILTRATRIQLERVCAGSPVASARSN